MRNVHAQQPGFVWRGRWLIGCAVVALLAIGVALATSSSDAASGLGNKKVIFVGFKASVTPYVAARNAAVQKAFKAAGVKYTLLASDGTPATQAQQLQQAISQHPSMIMLEPGAFPPMRPGLVKAKQAHIPVVAINNAPPANMSSLIKSVMKQNDVAQATTAGQILIAGLKAEGKTSGNVISVDGIHGMDATNGRLIGIKAALKKAPGLKLVESVDSAWDGTKAATLTQQLLAKYQSKGGIVGIYAMNADMAVGAAKAVQQAGDPLGVKKKGIIIVGDNCGPNSIAAIKAGTVYGDIAQVPTSDGATDAKAVIAFLKTNKIPAKVTYSYKGITPATVAQLAKPCTF